MSTKLRINCINVCVLFTNLRNFHEKSGEARNLYLRDKYLRMDSWMREPAEVLAGRKAGVSMGSSRWMDSLGSELLRPADLLLYDKSIYWETKTSWKKENPKHLFKKLIDRLTPTLRWVMRMVDCRSELALIKSFSPPPPPLPTIIQLTLGKNLLGANTPIDEKCDDSKNKGFFTGFPSR